MSVKDKRFIIILLLVRGGWKLVISDMREVVIVCYVIMVIIQATIEVHSPNVKSIYAMVPSLVLKETRSVDTAK